MFVSTGDGNLKKGPCLCYVLNMKRAASGFVLETRIKNLEILLLYSLNCQLPNKHFLICESQET